MHVLAVFPEQVVVGLHDDALVGKPFSRITPTSCCVWRPILLRDVATLVGVTERAAQRIVSELEQEGYLTRERVGRRNTYRLNPDRPLRHPANAAHTVGDLIRALLDIH